MPEINFTYRTPVESDASAIHQLIAEAPPLALNSPYCYLLLSKHFANSSLLALHNEVPIACLLAYLIPEHEETLFIWQIAVKAAFRRQGIASSMLAELTQSVKLQHVTHIQATVLSGNAASMHLFENFANSRSGQCQREDFVVSSGNLDPALEAECLITITL